MVQRILLLLVLLGLPGTLTAQSRITFQIDLGPLVREQLYSPDDGHRVFLRGSFNDWQGNEYELASTVEDNLYRGSFELEGSAGDTIAYKYVIQRGPDRIFWEDNPDPCNADHGNRRLVLTGADQLLPVASFHYNEYFRFPVIFSKEKLQADFRQFRSILEETHPALYDYPPKPVLESLFEPNYAAIQGSMDLRSFLLLMTEVIARVGCGHTSLWIPARYWDVAPDGLFPLKLFPSGDDFFVTGSFDGSKEIPEGSVILSINNIDFKEVTKQLESLSSSDGLILASQSSRTGLCRCTFPSEVRRFSARLFSISSTQSNISTG